MLRASANLKGIARGRLALLRADASLKGIASRPPFWGGSLAIDEDRQRLTLPGVILVPSALAGLTALFGMGRGDPRRYSHLKILKSCKL